MKQQLLLIFFSLLFFSCLNEDTKTIWVYPYLLNESYKYYRLDNDKICLAQNPPPRADFGFTGNTVEYKITPEGFLEFFDASGNLLIRFEPSA